MGTRGPRRKEQWSHTGLTQTTCLWVYRSLWRRRGSAVATDPDYLPVSVQESLVEAWVSGDLLQGQGHECSSACMGPFEGGPHYLLYLHLSLASGQTIGREHSPIHQQKIGLEIYKAWPRPSEQDPVSPSVSLSLQEISISLLSFFIRGQTDWKPQSQKTNQTDHMDHSLV